MTCYPVKYLFAHRSRMRNLIFAACFFIASGHLALAQYSRPPQSAQQAAEAQKLLSQYTTRFRNSGQEGRMLLDAIQGLAQTAENVQAVRSLLASNVTAEERVGLARILGRLYTYDNKTGLNAVIAQDLRNLVYTGSKEVAGAAVLAFSRLAYFKDSQTVLRYAKDNGYIDADAYYGELAHLFPFAPPNDQLGLVSEIKSDKNRYATDILASQLGDAQILATSFPETQRALKQYLEENEPDMPPALGEYDVIDAIRYVYWLHAVAALSASTRDASYSEMVFAHLNGDKTDPRKIMAFLSSSRGKIFISNVGRKALFEDALKRVTLYSMQLPQNALMRDAVKEITDAVNSLKA
jgi:hypothetical protein